MNATRRTAPGAAQVRAGLICLATALLALTPALAQDISVSLELNQQFYYAGDALPLRISVGNNGESTRDNPVKIDLSRGFSIRSGERTLERSKDAKVPEPSRPSKLAPRSFYGSVVDLAALYPELKQVGTYQIAWKAGSVESSTLTIRMLPKYDMSKKYDAVVKTTLGDFTIRFASDISPIGVKAFIDMANADFYDDLLMQEVRSGFSVAGGDPQYAATPRRPFLFPAEKSAQPILAGTVILKPAQPAPPANSSQFAIMLRPEPSLVGQVTILGQVVKGLDVIKRMSEEPSSLQSSRPYFKPLKDIKIRDIVVREVAAPKAGTAASQ